MEINIAKKLKELRKNKGYSMNYVSETLKEEFEIELSPKTLYGYENGVSQPNADTFVCLCKIYQVSDFNFFVENNL